MTRPSRAWLLPLLLPLLIGSGSRMQQSVSHHPVDTSTERYVRDLVGQDRSDRLYAARTLRSRLKTALKDSHRRETSLRYIDGIAALDVFDMQVAPACVDALEHRNVAHHCAWMLGALRHQDATPALEALLSDDSEASRRAQRNAAEALALIAGAP